MSQSEVTSEKMNIKTFIYGTLVFVYFTFLHEVKDAFASNAKRSLSCYRDPYKFCMDNGEGVTDRFVCMDCHDICPNSNADPEADVSLTCLDECRGYLTMPEPGLLGTSQTVDIGIIIIAGLGALAFVKMVVNIVPCVRRKIQKSSETNIKRYAKLPDVGDDTPQQRAADGATQTDHPPPDSTAYPIPVANDQEPE